jgi:uncharacterized membrane protein
VDIFASFARGHVLTDGFGTLGQASPGSYSDGPGFFPATDLLVTATGVLEILGAIGLMLPKVAAYGALGLAFMLVAVFPANIHAARQRLMIASRPVEALLPRLILQIVFLAATIAVFVAGK